MCFVQCSIAGSVSARTTLDPDARGEEGEGKLELVPSVSVGEEYRRLTGVGGESPSTSFPTPLPPAVPDPLDAVESLLTGSKGLPLPRRMRLWRSSRSVGVQAERAWREAREEYVGMLWDMFGQERWYVYEG